MQKQELRHRKPSELPFSRQPWQGASTEWACAAWLLAKMFLSGRLHSRPQQQLLAEVRSRNAQAGAPADLVETSWWDVKLDFCISIRSPESIRVYNWLDSDIFEHSSMQNWSSLDWLMNNTSKQTKVTTNASFMPSVLSPTGNWSFTGCMLLLFGLNAALVEKEKKGSFQVPRV